MGILNASRTAWRSGSPPRAGPCAQLAAAAYRGGANSSPRGCLDRGDLGLGGTVGKDRLDLAVRPGDDVRGSQAVAHALARVSTGTDCGVDRARLATHQHGDVAAADELAADQPHL